VIFAFIAASTAYVQLVDGLTAGSVK